MIQKYRIHILSFLFLQLILSTLTGCKTTNDKPGELPSSIARPVPFLTGIVADGLTRDWTAAYAPLKIMSDICGIVPDSNDFKTSFRIAWDKKGIYILAEFTDDSLYEDPDQFWKGDGLELFLSPGKGSLNIFQVSVRPGFDLPGSMAPCKAYDHLRSQEINEPEDPVAFFSQRTNQGYLLEGFVPFKMMGIVPHQQMEMAMQLYLNDADCEDDTNNYSLPWYSIRDSYRNPYAFQSIRLVDNKYPQMQPEIRAFFIDDQSLHLKVISERDYDRQSFSIRSSFFQYEFKLNPGGMDHKHWTVQAGEVPSGKEAKLALLTQDSILQVLDMDMAYHVYEHIDEPEWYENEIRIFEIMDKYSPPPINATLFTGSSTIRRWYSLAEDMGGMEVINRGFGGSVMKELNINLERIVFPYKPSMILVYEGDNDINSGTTPSDFLEECKYFIRQCHQRLPDTEIIFLSIKPSPARMRSWKQMARANKMLAELCNGYENVRYIDISTPMFSRTGVLKNDIYASDKVHLNDKGYALLRQTIKENIDKSLQ